MLSGWKGLGVGRLMRSARVPLAHAGKSGCRYVFVYALFRT